MAKYDKLLKRAEDADWNNPIATGELIGEIQEAEETKLITPKERKNIFKALKAKQRKKQNNS